MPDGDGIVIERRDESEISDLWYKQRMTPEKAGALNPAFDITDAGLITAFVTEKGVFEPGQIKNL